MSLFDMKEKELAEIERELEKAEGAIAADLATVRNALFFVRDTRAAFPYAEALLKVNQARGLARKLLQETEG